MKCYSVLQKMQNLCVFSNEVDTDKKVNVQSTDLDPEIRWIPNMLCEEYKDIISIHPSDIGHKNTNYHGHWYRRISSYCTEMLHPTAKINSVSTCEELEMLEKVNII